MVQVAPSDPASFFSRLYEALGDRIRSATLRTPTLEDVFMVHAGVAPNQDSDPVLVRDDDIGS
jgi:ABC-2 type transport system ATP-binding protein